MVVTAAANVNDETQAGALLHGEERGWRSAMPGIGPTSMPAAGGETGVAGIWLTHLQTQTQARIAADFCAVTPSLRFSHWVGATIHRCTLNDRRRSACRRCVVAPNGGRSAAGGAFLRLDAMR